MNLHDSELARRRADRYIARDGGEPCSLSDLRTRRRAQADALAKSIHQGIGAGSSQTIAQAYGALAELKRMAAGER